MVINLFKIHFEIIFKNQPITEIPTPFGFYIFPGPTPRTRIHVPDIKQVPVYTWDIKQCCRGLTPDLGIAGSPGTY